MVDDLPDLSGYHEGLVHITGGDPLLHNKLPQILHTLKQQKNFIILTSPCIRLGQLSPEIIRLIDLIFCYMPGVDQDSIREATGYDAYTKYYLTLSSLSELKRKVIVTYPLKTETITTLPDIYNLTVRLKHYLLLTLNRATESISGEALGYYSQRPTVIGYRYNDIVQKTCLGCPRKLWRLHPFALGILAQGFYKLYL